MGDNDITHMCNLIAYIIRDKGDDAATYAQKHGYLNKGLIYSCGQKHEIKLKFFMDEVNKEGNGKFVVVEKNFDIIYPLFYSIINRKEDATKKLLRCYMSEHNQSSIDDMVNNLFILALYSQDYKILDILNEHFPDRNTVKICDQNLSKIQLALFLAQNKPCFPQNKGNAKARYFFKKMLSIELNLKDEENIAKSLKSLPLYSLYRDIDFLIEIRNEHSRVFDILENTLENLYSLQNLVESREEISEAIKRLEQLNQQIK